jgi:hypothetical protein
MVLVCNDPAAAEALLSHWCPGLQPNLALRASRMARRVAESSELCGSARDEEAPAR